MEPQPAHRQGRVTAFFEFCRSVAELLDIVVFDVGSYRHLSDKAIGRKSVRWLFNAYELVQRRRYNEAISRISEIEVATSRALARIMARKGRKRLPKLPSYEEIIAENRQAEKEPEKPAWMLRYEEVNRNRLAQKPRSGEKDDS